MIQTRIWMVQNWKEHWVENISAGWWFGCLVVNISTVIMTTLGCPFTGCEEQVINADKDVAITLFNAHISTHTANAGRNQGSGPSKSKKLTRPKITQGMLVESWNSFGVLWNLYKKGAGLSEAECGLQLIYCCDKELMEQLLLADPNIVLRRKTSKWSLSES